MSNIYLKVPGIDELHYRQEPILLQTLINTKKENGEKQVYP